MPIRYDWCAPCFVTKEAAEKARNWYLFHGYECTEIEQLSNGAWGFEAKKPKT